MSQLVFATSNINKIKEVNAMLENRYQVISMAEIGCKEDIPETSPTIEGNALQKARYLHQRYQVDCFSEDTGLEVDQLDGAPGVITARYAGPERDANANMNLLLQNLAPHPDRSAQFRTVVALILNGEEHTFEGIVRGTISMGQRGQGGFGYDPIFIPEGYHQTFAELDSAIKNQISHRGRAIAKLLAFLQA